MNNSAVYDVIIIGGGMVGASLLAALRNHADKKIALIEAVPFDSSAQPSFYHWVYGRNSRRRLKQLKPYMSLIVVTLGQPGCTITRSGSRRWVMWRKTRWWGAC